MTECWWVECREEAGKDGLCPAHHAKDLRLKRTYGIGLAEVQKILEAQNWACPVCTRALGADDWVLDHSHRHKFVRGCLCRACNHRVVGRHEDWLILAYASKYLQYPPAVTVLGNDPTVPKKKRRRKKAAPKK